MSTAFPRVPSDTDASTNGALLDTVRAVIPVIEESLVVDKRWVDQGGWRVTKRVDSREQLVDEALRSQDVAVERRPIGELLVGREPPAPRQEGDTWILPVVEEVLVTEKRLFLKEEIRITRTDGSRRHSEQITLRSEEVSIERLEPGTPPDIVSP